MLEVSVPLASVFIDGLPLRFRHGALVTSPQGWQVALFDVRPAGLAPELCSVVVMTSAGQELSGTARADRCCPDGCLLMLEGQGKLDSTALTGAAQVRTA